MATVNTQKHPLRIQTPLGNDMFILKSLQGFEGLSEPFRFQLNVLADPSLTFTFDQLLGQKVTATIQMPQQKQRYINGVVYRLAQGPQVRVEKDQKPWTCYQLEIVPQFWFLKRTVRTQYFQQQAVPDILKTILGSLDVSWKIDGTFEPRDYCVQYRESDFDFASRLMEEEGIWYYFDHSESGHQMVIGNSPSSHGDVADPSTLNYDDSAGGQYTEDVIFIWEKEQEVRSGKYTLWDYCFEMPDKNLECDKEVTDSAQVGTVSHKLSVANNSTFEIYDYPGGYAGRFDGVAPGGSDQSSNLQKIFDDNKRTVGIRMQEETVPALTITGRSMCKNLSAGHKFTLAKHYNGNGSYVLTRVEHTASLQATTRGGITSGIGGKLRYQNRFTCIPATVPFSPPRVTPIPFVHGVQTAVVVGPSDQEIFTDKYGRVKVQFHWDRTGQNDSNSSCWIRVGTPWSGKQWGMIHIPRIGQEVIVAFEEGDPNQPIIVGCVYNATNMPPYTLPDNQTQSGIKTRSSLKGDETTWNELRFEDKKDSEEIYFRAQKDFTHVVLHNHSLTVGADTNDTTKEGSQTISIYKDRTLTVQTGNETTTISKGNRTATISEGNESLEVTKGTRTVTVEGDDTHEVKSGNRVVKVDKGNDTLTVSQGSSSIEINQDCSLTVKTGNYTIKVNAGKITVEAAQSIEMTVGSSSVKIEPSAITLTSGAHSIKVGASSIAASGPKIDVNGSLQTSVQGAMTEVKASGVLTLQGSLTKIN